MVKEKKKRKSHKRGVLFVSFTHTAEKRMHSPCIFSFHQWVSVFSAASSPKLLPAAAAAAAALCVYCNADIQRLYNHGGEEEGPVGSGRQDARLRLAPTAE